MKRDIGALTQKTFDLVILGGGITGAGAALDAAARGWSVALIDKGDFASGTSSASSKLIHGGLRYLEYGQLTLVHEALRERALLLGNAPHLVKPLPFILPFYRSQRIPPWKARLGLTIYDLLAGSANIARSRPLSLRALAHDASLRTPDLLGGAVYWDALTDDARLCLAVLQSAAQHGAALANYVEAVGFEKHQGVIAGVWARDRVGGEPFSPRLALAEGHASAKRMQDHDPFLIRGRVVLNATGPWCDAVAHLAGDNDGPWLQPTKGVHIIAPDRGHPAAYLLLHPCDGRVFFVIPWERKTLIGTTDTDPATGPDALEVLPEEIAYLLEGYNHHFAPGLSAMDVMGAFAGLRPLLRAGAGEPSARSREFRLISGRSGLVTVAGGKYTTYRQMAETTIDFLGQRLGRSRRCRTRTLRLAGAPAERWQTFFERTLQEIQRPGLTPDCAAHLVHRYGDRVGAVLRAINESPEGEGARRLHPDEPDLVGEQAYQRAEEMALFRTDLFLRRSRIGMYRPEVLAEANGVEPPDFSRQG